MIEAVTSAVSNASLLRGGAEQINSLRSAELSTLSAPKFDTSTIELPKAPYISPRVSVDSNYNQAVLQILDSETGDVLTQFPTERTLQSRQSEQLRLEQSPGADIFAAEFDAIDTQSSASVETQPSLPISIPNVSVEVQTSQARVTNEISSGPTSSGVAQAQIAAAALANGSQASVPTSGNVSVTA